MKTVKVLTEHRGEISYTKKDFVGIIDSDGKASSNHRDVIEYDLDAKKWACYTSDDFRQIEVERFAVAEVELPDWLDPFEWLQNCIYWRYVWGFGVGLDWPEKFQRFVYSVKNESLRYGIVKLLATGLAERFRSNFRKSLFGQVVAWLEKEPEDRNFDFPLSPRQCEFILPAPYVAKRVSDAIYWNR